MQLTQDRPSFQEVCQPCLVFPDPIAVESQSWVRFGLLLASLRVVLIFDCDHFQLILFGEGLEEGRVGVPKSHALGVPVALFYFAVYLA